MIGKKENSNKKPSIGIKSLLGGKLLENKKVSKQIPFIIFLTILGIGLITNRYVAEKTIREIEIVRDSLKVYKSESVIHETKLMYINRPSEVSKKVIERKIDLLEPVEPPVRIKVKKMEAK